jgi:SAM-dependent methyltransferase
LDFLQGKEFPDFHLDPDDPAQQACLQQEAAGIAWRMKGFILPLIGRYSRATEKSEQALAVLDCGCGNGLSVDILRAQGMQAFGIDAGRARHQQWHGRSFRSHLHSANALGLPFDSASFDVVLSSGLVEHIGIHEEESGDYRAWRLPDCHAQRQQFVTELVRVLKSDGFILLDHPNGGAPADFWHGGKPGSLRWHALRGDMLPRFDEIANYFRAADPSLHLYSLSPRHRLRFHRVRNHWYGVVFAPLMKIWLRAMEIPVLSFLARSFLNPYLVTLASRQQAGPLIRTHDPENW